VLVDFFERIVHALKQDAFEVGRMKANLENAGRVEWLSVGPTLVEKRNKRRFAMMASPQNRS
jgi:hypothetical protein